MSACSQVRLDADEFDDVCPDCGRTLDLCNCPQEATPYRLGRD